MEERTELSYKTLLMLDYGYTMNQLFDLLEEKKRLIGIGFTFNEIFETEWLRLKMEDIRNGI